MSTARPSRILVPLDGSALAEQALWVAAALAHRARATLRIVTVHVPARAADADTGEPSSRAGGGREVHDDLLQYLRGRAEELATTHGVSCGCAVLHGWPPDALVEDVGANGIDLVVMTAHGRGGVSRWWIGSVTDGLLARVPVPVLLLRPGIAPPRARFLRVLVALDGSAGSSHVLAQTLALTLVDPAEEYMLATVVEPSTPLPRRSLRQPGSDPLESLARRRAAAARGLERRAERLRGLGLAVTTHAVVGQGAGEELLELSQRLGSDLIVVGTQRPRTAERLVLGSVADKVVRGATQTVLIVPVRRHLTRAARRRPRRARRAITAIREGP